MFILEVHSWSFLSIFEAETNLYDAYKKSACNVCCKTFTLQKILIGEIDFLGETNEFHYQMKKVFTQNEPNFTSNEYFWTYRESQWGSGSCYCNK